MAELEVRGEYSEVKHDALFESFGQNGLDEADLALLPDYLVRINAASLNGAEQSKLNEILAADLPIKVLVQTDDVIEESPVGNGHLAFALRSRQLASMAMGINDVSVLQAPSASLPTAQSRSSAGSIIPARRCSVSSRCDREQRRPAALPGRRRRGTRVTRALGIHLRPVSGP